MFRPKIIIEISKQFFILVFSSMISCSKHEMYFDKEKRKRRKKTPPR